MTDWRALVKALCPRRGDLKTIAEEMQRAGLSVTYYQVRKWAQRGYGNGNPHGDAAVWLYKEATRLGLDIPERK